MKHKGTASRAFCEHWGEITVPSAARKALETMIPSSSRPVIPVSLEAAARRVGIEQVLDVEMSNCDGLLSRTPSGSYIATLRRSQGATRKRFTLAHEIGHAIVFRSIGHRAERADGVQLSCRAESADERDEERLCDALASELLMPRVQFLETMEAFGVSASTVPSLGRRFGVSLQAASRRVAQLLPYDVGVGLWYLNEQNSGLVPQWYVTKVGAMSLEYVLDIGRPGSECFTDKVVRGWHWVPLQGQMEKYFIDVSPLSGPNKAWIVFVIFSDAAEHIMATISKPRKHSRGNQLSLVEE